MNNKETQVPIYIAVIVALILIAAAGYYVLGKPVHKTQLKSDTTSNQADEIKIDKISNGYVTYVSDEGEVYHKSKEEVIDYINKKLD